MRIVPLQSPAYVVFHHTGTPPERDLGAVELDAKDRAAGYRSIGYHWVIRRDGTLEPGRPDTEPGVHTPGFDRRAISVAVVGPGPDHQTIEQQQASLVLGFRYPETELKDFAEIKERP